MQDQVAIVTGASRGIGRAIALGLGRHGAKVIGTATTEAGAEVISQALRDAGIEGTGLTVDVRDPGACEFLVSETGKRYGEPSILVNNAGITRDNLLLRMKDDEWNDIIATNLTPVYRLSRLVLRGMMKARYGRIINISSVVGSMGNAGQTNYAAAKAGMTGFTKSLAREVGSRHITVNCVAPGFIETDMTRDLPADAREALLRNIPLGRLGNPDDVAAAVAFLAGPEAAYMTGCTLHVNGGMLMD
ncbi:MAG: 3-oxoacyl-ACP reductase FabG [Pseudomonadota bacterium]